MVVEALRSMVGMERFALTPRARERRPVTSREGPGILASRPVRRELVAG